MAIDLSQWAPSLTAFADWLAVENQGARKAWSRRLNSSKSKDNESAIAEAMIWDFIGCRCESTRLNDAPGTGGVDFAFVVDGRTFLVEVTNISTEAASTASAMPDKELFSGFYCLLTKQIRQKVRGKFKQARKQSDHPLLVAVTTLHWNASCACINRTAVEFALGSPTRITGNLNPNTGDVEGGIYESTDLSQSVFLSPHPVIGPEGSRIAQAKYQPISGFLVGGFGLDPPNVRVFGALNPEASQPFNSAALPDVPFCSFREWPVTTEIAFDWTISEQDEREQEQQAAECRLRAAGHGGFLDSVRQEIDNRPRRHED